MAIRGAGAAGVGEGPRDAGMEGARAVGARTTARMERELAAAHQAKYEAGIDPPRKRSLRLLRWWDVSASGCVPRSIGPRRLTGLTTFNLPCLRAEIRDALGKVTGLDPDVYIWVTR